VRVTLIHNPGAGSDGGTQLGALQRLIRDQGHELRAKSCRDDDWIAVLDAPADMVAVAGGDGTVARVAKQLVGRGLPVAPIPAGTANNISTALGLVGRPIEELVRQWSGSRTVKLDIGMAEGPWGRRHFIEGVGVGLFANTVPMVDAKLQRQGPDAPREKVKFALQKILERLERARPVALEAVLDGRDVSGQYVLFEALNLPYVGPNLFLAPDSKRGDGQFDLVMAGEAERERLAHYLATWQEEKSRLAVLPSRQGKRLEIRWTGYPVHIDDEFWPEDGVPPPGAGHIELTLGSAAVEFLVPAKKDGDR
jgi:diacylglycerol kinase (ATP)